MAVIDLLPTAITDALRAPFVAIVPIYNEEATIARVVAEWTQAFAAQGIDYQLLLINDGSSDRTLEVLKGLEANDPARLVVVAKTNSGHGLSCRLGYDCAAASGAEWVFQIDSDGQCDPSYFPQFWQRAPGSDCVFGRRVSRDDGPARRFTSMVCNRVSSLIAGTELGDANVPYRLIRRTALAQALPKIPRHFNIHNVALTCVLRRTPGLRWDYVPIHFRERQGGANSINVPAVMKLGCSMLFELAQIKK